VRIIAGSDATQARAEEAVRALQLVELILDAIADAALQQGRDVLVQFAILPPQCGNRYGHGRLHMPQAQDRAAEPVSERSHPGGPHP